MIQVKDIIKRYKSKGGAEIKALDGVTIDFPEKGMVFILGKSGSGKSTLLNIVGGLDMPDGGELIVKGKSSKDFSATDFDGYRNTYIGFVFQEYNILGEFNVAENIALALQLQGKKNDSEAVEKILEKVDLAGLGNRKSQTLSGGQKQRVAIARALVKDPEIIMADEPTGALDSATGKEVFNTLKKLSEEKLVIVVSHDREFAEEYGDRIIELKDGKVISDLSKQLREAENLSGNVIKINEGTIELRGDLTEEEFKKAYNMIKSSGGNIIISSDREQVQRFKAVNRITEEGGSEYFTETAESAPAVSESDGHADFFKSKMPLRHAIRMGATGLKARPFRLFLTVLTSVLAFAMFGIISTMMLYDVNYTVAKALKGTDYNCAFLGKHYKSHETRYSYDETGARGDVNEYDYNSYVLTSAEDVENVRKKTGKTVFGVYNFSGEDRIELSDIYNLDRRAVNAYYSLGAFSGASDAGEAAVLQAFGSDARVAGRYPESPHEIAVTRYTYELIAACGLFGETEIKSPEDLIGKRLSVEDDEYTVTGVYNTGDINKKFDGLKSSADSYSDLAKEFSEVYAYSVHTLAFVSETFYSGHLVNKAVKEWEYPNSHGWAYLDYSDFMNSDFEDRGYLSFQFPEWLKHMENPAALYNFTDGAPVSFDKLDEMKDDETYISLGGLISRCTELAKHAVEDTLSYWHVNEEFSRAYARLYYAANGSFPDYINEKFPLGKDDECGSPRQQDIATAVKALNADWNSTMQSDGVDSDYGDFDKFYYRGGRYLKISGVYCVEGSKDFYLVTEAFIRGNGESYTCTVTEIKTKYKPDETAKYVATVVPFKTETGDLNKVLKLCKVFADDSNYYFEDNKVYASAVETGEFIADLWVLFLVAGIVLGVLSALFLFNYISVSISYKQREIGILRALGARGSDVFKIFFSESVILATVCSVIAMIVALISCKAINSYLVSGTVFALEFLNFNIVNCLILFAVAMAVAFAATILPVYFAAKKKPVDSIRAL